MSFNIRLACPSEIESNPEAIKYLERGATDFGGMASVAKCLEQARNGAGIFILINSAIKLAGAAYLTFTQQETGRIMTSVLLAGDDFVDWWGELREFYYKLLKEQHCDEFVMMGRRGFKKFFPELEEVATVFRLKLPYGYNNPIIKGG